MRRLGGSVLILAILFSYSLGQTDLGFGQIWQKQGTGPLIHVQGDSGSWNGGDIAFDWNFGHVLQDEDTLKLYIGASDGEVFSIGMYTSMDVDSGWEEYPGNPIMTGTPGAWDSVNVGAPMVIKQDGQYKMWYTGNNSYEFYAPRTIGYATSPDGISWTKHPDPVLESSDFPTGLAVWIRNPYVIAETDTLKMWLCTSPGSAYDEDIHYAWSIDGIEWVMPSSDPVIAAPANKWVAFPSVRKDGDNYVMWYGEGGYGTGYNCVTKTAVSLDGVIWRTDDLYNPVLRHGSAGEFDEDGSLILDVIEDGEVHWAFTTNWQQGLSYVDIGLVKYSPTIIAAGDVSGTWTKAGSPYRVQGEISIPDGETLTIEPGTTVQFVDFAPLRVRGRILAQGSEAEPIRFWVDDTLGFSNMAGSDGFWRGIRFGSTPVTNDSSLISYCDIRFSKNFAGEGGGLWGVCGGAFYISNMDKLRIEHSLIKHNRAIGDYSNTDTYGAGLAILNASPIIAYNTIENNVTRHLIQNKWAHGGGLIIIDNSEAQIIGNTIRNNRCSDVGGGVAMWGSGCNPILINNLIVENSAISNDGYLGYGGGFGGGGDCYPTFINNTIARNRAGWGGGGVYFNAGDGNFINTIIAENVWINSDASYGHQVAGYGTSMQTRTLNFINTCLQGGRTEIMWGTDNTGRGGTVNFRQSLWIDPELTSNYSLTTSRSQCFGAGMDMYEIEGVTYYAPQQDIDGNPRPNPAGSLPDMGAFESNLHGHRISTYWNWWQYQDTPVLTAGAYGTWDDISAYLVDVLPFQGQYHMWYSGWGGGNLSIGHATSEDGINWVKNSSNPIFVADPNTWQDNNAYAPRILQLDDVLHMWFFSNNKSGHATSTNGINWTVTPDPVFEGTQGTWDEEMAGISDVIYRDSLFHAWYTGVNANNYAVGYATSTDGIEWVKHPDPVFDVDDDGWDSGILYVSSVVWNGYYYYMWYYANNGSGNPGIGQAKSTDGINWIQVSVDGPEIGEGPGLWSDDGSFAPTVLLEDGRYRMWYSGNSSNNNLYPGYSTGYASLEPVDVEEGYDVEVPQSFMLSQNYPNPFNPMTTIRYAIPENGDIRLVIYDVLGREVIELVNGHRNVGNYETIWNGIDKHGNLVSTGIYLARLEAGHHSDVIKMLFLK